MNNLTDDQIRWVDQHPYLARWYAAPVGRALLRNARRRLANHLPRVFGHRALQIGDLGPDGRLLDDTATLRQVLLDTRGGAVGADVVGNALQLPFEDGSIQVVYLPHTLDFSSTPHQVLREANRVLSDDGFLVLIGFNLWSGWGLRRALLRWRRGMPWRGHFYSPSRVADWLSVLDFKVTERVGVGPAVAWGAQPSGGKLRLTVRAVREFGAPVYVLLARKQTIPMTPAQIARARQPKRNTVVAGAFARHSNERRSHRENPSS